MLVLVSKAKSKILIASRDVGYTGYDVLPTLQDPTNPGGEKYEFQQCRLRRCFYPHLHLAVSDPRLGLFASSSPPSNSHWRRRRSISATRVSSQSRADRRWGVWPSWDGGVVLCLLLLIWRQSFIIPASVPPAGLLAFSRLACFQPTTIFNSSRLM